MRLAPLSATLSAGAQSTAGTATAGAIPQQFRRRRFRYCEATVRRGSCRADSQFISNVMGANDGAEPTMPIQPQRNCHMVQALRLRAPQCRIRSRHGSMRRPSKEDPTYTATTSAHGGPIMPPASRHGSLRRQRRKAVRDKDRRKHEEQQLMSSRQPGTEAPKYYEVDGALQGECQPSVAAGISDDPDRAARDWFCRSTCGCSRRP